MKRLFILTMLLAWLGNAVQGADFLSTETCEKTFDLGVRLGINTTNRTTGTNIGYDRQSWGTGFDAGVVADINLRDYISVQPGFFFESRSGSYTFVTAKSNDVDPLYYITQAGHRRSYNFTIPILASLRFNLSDNLRWLVEAGPYVSFVLSSKLINDELVSTGVLTEFAPPFEQKPASADFGLKLGTGLLISDHYYVGVHYEAGLTKAYKDQRFDDVYIRKYGGHTKAWLFTIGYNF